MIFLVHYIVKAGVKDLHFDMEVEPALVSARALDSLRLTLASDASQKIGGKKSVTPDEVVIANVIPIPSGEPAQQGGS